MQAKEIRVKLLDEAKEEFERLEKIVGDEKGKGINSSFHQTLLKGIKEKIRILRENCDAGMQIRKKLIPKKYLEKFSVTNLWKLNLPSYWRMIYTIRQPQHKDMEVEVLTIFLDVVDILNHKQYSKIFGYRKK
ncbi:MAG: hypothetical protein V1494_01430 [Candidatus Diapherotrites archaeon]